MDLYRDIESFQAGMPNWSNLWFRREIAAFEEQMNLILEGQQRSFPTASIGESKVAFLLLVSRLFNDFQAAKNDLVVGLTDQAVMHIRDAVETTLLIELFIVDNKRAMRWLKDLKEYSASNVIRTLQDEHGIDLPLMDLYRFLSQLAHPNLLGALNTVTEIDAGEDQVLRSYHFGGVKNESAIRLILGHLVLVQMISLYSLAKAFVGMDPEFTDWWSRVSELPSKLHALYPDQVEGVERQNGDIHEQVYAKLKFQAFTEKYRPDLSTE